MTHPWPDSHPQHAAWQWHVVRASGIAVACIVGGEATYDVGYDRITLSQEAQALEECNWSTPCAQAALALSL